MTKSAFLQWLAQFRHTQNIRVVVEQRIWSEAELDRLKENLENGGRLAFKNEAKRRMAWG